MPCSHYIIEGRVQGVFFRVSTRDRALEIGLLGWVRNLADGRVEAVACGEKEQLDVFELWLNHGPDMAVVEHIVKENWAEEAELSGFNIK